jgi:hypothetical protein
VIDIEPASVKVGFDILQLISSSMYVDPLTLYREYVQNAADSIEQARLTGVLNVGSRGCVEINPDSLARSITIRDNGTGITNERFASALLSVGASSKRALNFRGFRGIGRLVGLGYCQELLFRSRSVATEAALELKWDCRLLRDTLRSSSPQDLTKVISQVATIRALASDEWPSHFFEVELKGIVRHLDDQLLNYDEIQRYLSQVAPIPFADDFRFGGEINAALHRETTIEQLEIRLNGMPECLTRPYGNVFSLSASRSTRPMSLHQFTIPAIDEGVAAVGWVAHHEYLGAFPDRSLIGGIRVRDGNIQIGDSALLDPIFTEPRFNSWCVGEVHVIDRRIIANGRRDNFESNVHYGNLLNHLAPLARELSRLCRTSSVTRNSERKFSQLELELQQMAQLFTKKSQLDVLLTSALSRITELLKAMLTIVEKLSDSERQAQLRARYDIAVQDVSRIRTRMMRRGTPKYSARTRGQLDVLELVYEAAEGLTSRDIFIGRVLEGLHARLTAQHRL